MRTRLDEIRQTGRNAIGVRLMDLNDDDFISGIAIMDGSPDLEGEGEGEEAAVNGDVSTGTSEAAG